MSTELRLFCESPGGEIPGDVASPGDFVIPGGVSFGPPLAGSASVVEVKTQTNTSGSKALKHFIITSKRAGQDRNLRHNS